MPLTAQDNAESLCSLKRGIMRSAWKFICSIIAVFQFMIVVYNAFPFINSVCGDMSSIHLFLSELLFAVL
jgi:hypothetical protein